MCWCFHCYGLNAAQSGPCVHCGRPIEPPASISYDERLIWTLGHPDGDRALIAARTLGEHRVTSAEPALRSVIATGSDPFLAAEALRSLIKIEGAEPIRGLLQELSGSESFMVAEVARRALARLPPVA
jgi:hypothetical protein